MALTRTGFLLPLFDKGFISQSSSGMKIQTTGVIREISLGLRWKNERVYTSGIGGDQYEPDNVPSRASQIQTNGSIQSHTITSADMDWINFVGMPGTMYTISIESDTSGKVGVFIDSGRIRVNSSQYDIGTTVKWYCKTADIVYLGITSLSSDERSFRISLTGATASVPAQPTGSWTLYRMSGNSMGQDWDTTFNPSDPVVLLHVQDSNIISFSRLAESAFTHTGTGCILPNIGQLYIGGMFDYSYENGQLVLKATSRLETHYFKPYSGSAPPASWPPIWLDTTNVDVYEPDNNMLLSPALDTHLFPAIIS